jgi:3-isopropylmalate/(R)-2-methylmalate dehydratase small subunit
MLFKQVIKFPPLPGDFSPLIGTAHKFGDQISADMIIAPWCRHIYPNTEMAQFTFEGIDPDFISRVKYNDIVAAGENFGAFTVDGLPATALRVCGIAAVCAVSFAPEFLNYAKNEAIVLLSFPEAKNINGGDRLEIDFDEKIIRNITQGVTYTFS